MKLVFLVQTEAPRAVASVIRPDMPYEFKPYHYGPYSRGVVDDLDSLEERGDLTSELEPIDTEGRYVRHLYSITDSGQREIANLAAIPAASTVRAVLKKYAKLTGAEIVRYVHETYPTMIKT